jgi:hypothetical protein
LTEKDNTFDERAVLRAHAQATGQGATIKLLRARAAGFAGRGDVLATQRGEMTTAELVGVERALIAAAQGRAGEGTGRVDEPTLLQALAGCEREMTGQQRAAVHATVTSGHGVQVIEALAGTGKTFTAGALAYVYRAGGLRRARRRVHGARGPRARRRGADPLANAGSDGARGPQRHRAAHRVRGGARRGRDGRHPRDRGPVGGGGARGGEVVAIGDPGQLHSVQAGGWMRAVERRVGVLKLSVVMRQRDHGERRALGLLYEGVPGGWLAWAREHGRVELGGTGATPERAVQEWEAAVGEHGLDQAVLIARSNDTRAALNERAREVVRARGSLGAERE